MQNRTGAIVTDDDFFPRKNIITQIYRRLDAKNHLFMAAPRRAGKSSIMYYLKDHPRDNYIFVYVVVQSVHDIDEYYKRILEALFKSEAIGKLAKGIASVGSFLRETLKQIGNFDFWGVGVELKETQPNYQQAVEKILSKLNAENNTIVLMIDELPDAVVNISEKHGNQVAILFLQQIREQRQYATHGFRFIFTGSIGLPNVVKNLLPSSQIISDLNVVEVPPLTRQEATQFLTLLFDTYQIPYQNEVIEHLLDKMEWFIPFHLQLAFQEMIDIYDQTQAEIKIGAVDIVFKQLLHSRNNSFFEHYYKRLSNYPIALEYLQMIAKKATIKQKNLEQTAEQMGLNKADCERTIEMLVFDGYVYKSEKGVYQFNSLLLKMWWIKYVCN